jgi:hypothetical protein
VRSTSSKSVASGNSSRCNTEPSAIPNKRSPSSTRSCGTATSPVCGAL